MNAKPDNRFDEFVVDCLLQGFLMPSATRADRAAAVQEWARRGLATADMSARLSVSQREVERLRHWEVVPLGPIPDWARQDRQWPRCPQGHELTPDNVVANPYRRRGGNCGMCRAHNEKQRYQRSRKTSESTCR